MVVIGDASVVDKLQYDATETARRIKLPGQDWINLTLP